MRLLRFINFLFLCFCIGMGPAVSVSLAQEEASGEVELLDFAHGLLEQGLYQMSGSEYQKFIQQYPKSKKIEDAYLGLGESLFLEQDNEAALEALKQFKDLFPQSEKLSVATLRRGQALFKLGRFDEALSELRSANPDAMAGQLRQNFYFFMAKTFRAKGDSTQAKSFYLKAAEVKDASLYTSYAYQELAEIDLEEKQFASAASLYEKAASAAPEDTKAQFILNQAEVLFLSEDYLKAIPIFKSLILQSPQSEVARGALANMMLAYFNLGEYREALAVFNDNAAMVEERAEFFSIYSTLSLIYIEMERFDDAFQLLEKILLIEGINASDRGQIILRKAEVLIKQKKHEDALALLNADNGAALDAALSGFLKAKAFYGMSNIDKALEFFKKVKDEHPSSGFANPSLWGIAQIEYDRGNYQEAKNQYAEYFLREKNSKLRHEALYNMILLDAKLGDNAKAIENAQKYMTLFIEGAYYEKVILLLAEFYAQTQEYSKAIALLQQYLNTAKNVESPDAVLFLLGYNQQLASLYEDALGTYSKVSAREANGKFYASALKNTAQIYLVQENLPQAANYFDKLIMEVDPKAIDLKTYFWLCGQYVIQKRADDILRVIEKAESAYPDEDKEKGSYFKAEAYREKGDCKRAEDFYAQALKLKQGDVIRAAARIGNGLCLSERGEHEKAVAEFAEALEENADDHTVTLRARFESARALQAQNKNDEALRFYLLVSTLYDDPEFCPKALWAAGALMESSGKRIEALKLYEEILARYPQSPLRESAEKAIKGVK